MAIPESIKKHKPDVGEYGSTEIRCIKNHYYVYLISSRWDPEKKRAKKITGKSIGKITEKDGFIPNANYYRMFPSKRPVAHMYGVFVLLEQLGESISYKLEAIFPDIYREIKIIAMLKLAYNASPVIMESCFGSSYLSDLYPDVTINEETVNKLVSELGSERRAEITNFMRLFYPNNPAVLIDGTDIFTRGYGFLGGMSFFSEPEPDERMRFLCIFSDINHAPVFSRAVPYDLTDMSVIAETIELSGLRKCTVFVDEDFYSDKNMAFLKENHLKFIMQLYSSTKLIPKKSPDKQKWDGRLAFTWGRDIMHRKIAYRKKKYDKFGNYLYLFFDYTDYDEDDPDWQLYSEEDCMLAFISSQNVDAKKIYTAYREKKEIEECYRYMGRAADIETLYKASSESL